MYSLQFECVWQVDYCPCWHCHFMLSLTVAPRKLPRAVPKRPDPSSIARGRVVSALCGPAYSPACMQWAVAGKRSVLHARQPAREQKCCFRSRLGSTLIGASETHCFTALTRRAFECSHSVQTAHSPRSNAIAILISRMARSRKCTHRAASTTAAPRDAKCGGRGAARRRRAPFIEE